MARINALDKHPQADQDLGRILDELRQGDVLDQKLEEAVDRTLDGFQREYARLIQQANEQADHPK